MVAGAESAIVVEIPDLDALVDGYRQSLDPSRAWGVRAHVTLLYPFAPPWAITAEHLNAIERIASGADEFEVIFSRVRWFGEEVAWLAPDPAEPFASLTRKLASAFPAHPPYGGVHDPVPHLTIGQGASAELVRAATDVAAELPVRARVRQVTLLTGSRSADSWRPLRRFPMAAR